MPATDGMVETGPVGAEAPVPPVDVRAGSSAVADDERRGTWKRLVAIVATLGVLAAGVFYLLSATSEDAFVYSKLVPDVVRNRAQFVGQEIRVEGELTQGSVRFRQDPCEWRFQLEKAGHHLPVRFPQCIVPDSFRDNMGISVTVQGKLGEDGTFVANQVVPRCPSRYEMNQRKNAGQGTPHGEEVPGASYGGVIPAATR